jgi:hypothetical protein
VRHRLSRGRRSRFELASLATAPGRATNAPCFSPTLIPQDSSYTSALPNRKLYRQHQSHVLQRAAVAAAAATAAAAASMSGMGPQQQPSQCLYGDPSVFVKTEYDQGE